MRIAILAAALALTAAAQRQKITINAETPEGQLLQQIGQEADEAKKLALMEKFVAEYPKHEGAAWVYAQMVPVYVKGNQFDKALDAGDKLLALDPQDLEVAHQTLKAAEGKKDPDLVIKWSAKASELARKAAQAPKPADEEAAEAWKASVDFGKQLDTYTEYSLYALALQTTDPRKKVALIDALEQRNPQSQYLPQIASQRFIALRQAGEEEKAVALAEKILEKDQSDEDMLLIVANSHMQRKNPDKVIAYSSKILEVLNTKQKPAAMSDADWEKKKNLTTGVAHWMIGMTYASQGRWSQADSSLRSALPLIFDDQLRGPALFYLGLANFRLGEKTCEQGRILDAYKFTQASAAIKGQFQGSARTNLKAFQGKCAAR